MMTWAVKFVTARISSSKLMAWGMYRGCFQESSGHIRFLLSPGVKGLSGSLLPAKFQFEFHFPSQATGILHFTIDGIRPAFSNHQ